MILPQKSYQNSKINISIEIIYSVRCETVTQFKRCNCYFSISTQMFPSILFL